MKKQIRKWSLRITAICIVIVLLLAGILLNPSTLYANKVIYKNYTIYYHTASINPALLQQLDTVTSYLKKSELYKQDYHIEICLNDGSMYPLLVQSLQGAAFGWGFYDKVVLAGTAHYNNNFVELRGYKWNLTHLLIHEAVHCLQFSRWGLLKSNPVAGIPAWKWEGYPEYIARARADQQNLQTNITKLQAVLQTDNNGWINFADGTGTSISYYKNWLLIMYCMDVKKWTYESVLKDTSESKVIEAEMMAWYQQHNQ